MRRLVSILFFIVVGTVSYSQGKGQLLIAAASDLKFALDSVVTVFKKGHAGVRIDVTYGSSGKLYEQISHTAPFDLFFSADIEYPLNLRKNGIAISEVVRYGVGYVVIWSKTIDPNRAGMNTLTDNRVTKIAIANPQHAPYGRRAEEALKHYKLYDEVRGKLVFGENISQTAQFVTTGAADVGIIALSLALSPTMKKQQGHYYLIPSTSHKPLEQGFVILRNAEKNALAVTFKDFMSTEKATAILSYFGFTKK